MAPAQRDPLSVRYDTAARRVLLASIRKQQSGRPGWTYIWVASPGHEVRDLDPGGLTRHERAFRRSLFYPVVQIPRRMYQPQQWSLRTEMVDGFTRRGSRYGRWCRVRIYRYGSGYRKVARSPASSYVNNPALRSRLGEDGVRVIPRVA